MARSMISAGDVNEDGRVVRYENGECESPAWILLLRGEIRELYCKIGLELVIYKCCEYVGRYLR